MQNPCAFLLDRNVVDLIKESNDGKFQTDKKKIDFLNYLHSIDYAGASISPILSVIEGEHGQEDTADEKSSCQKKESDALRKFFNFAMVDSDFLDATSLIFGKIFTEFREAGWARREQFSEMAAPIIVEQVKREERKKVEFQILDLARSCGLKSSEPIVVLMLACLYESRDARKLIKPKNFRAYNVLSDLHVLSRFNLIVAIGKKFSQSLQFEFVSRDEGLKGVLNHIKVVCQNINGEELNLSLKYLHGLFPALSDQEHKDLLNRLVKADTFDLVNVVE